MDLTLKFWKELDLLRVMARFYCDFYLDLA